MNDYVLFEGPWVKAQGEYPTRIILHAEVTPAGDVRKYIVHRQYRNERGELHLESGDYFHVEWDDALGRALDKFHERCRAHYISIRKFLYLEEEALA